MTITRLRVLLLLALAVAPFGASAEIYKIVDQDGVTRYTDKPPSKDATPIEIRSPQTYTNDSMIDEAAPESEPEGVFLPDIVEYNMVELLAPTDDQVFNTGSNSVTAIANLSPSLQAGHKLMFLVDGQSVAVPYGQTSTELTGLTRDTHSLQVVVMDAGNNIQAQSQTIHFHLHQPSTLQPGFDPTPGSAPRPQAGPQTPIAPGQRTRPPLVP